MEQSTNTSAKRPSAGDKSNKVSRKVDAFAVSLDGTKCAAVLGGGIRLWDRATNRTKHMQSGHDGRITSIAFSSSGDLFATASTDKSIKLWDSTIDQRYTYPLPSPTRRFDPSTDPQQHSRVRKVGQPLSDPSGYFCEAHFR
ncbi:hypothetical protein GCG54_00001051 [Colletotrichum gloeosporioides]|uniref:Mitochondrial division protein 1 n=1 Tax=Colletotrichum gloeosporioides TaxID=474922 RepID=A0A8H4CA18_COLGL|nr:uncharacterized protein GCG54_00001051 [Colletotrichum gloeosporioides]KAF3799943.1 hypothetical protein GCG54_00001051 [Colletotrichum gloeosporioides]